MSYRTAFRCGVVLAAVLVSAVVRADEVYDSAVMFNEAEVAGRELSSVAASSSGKWQAILQPVSLYSKQLEEAMERAADRSSIHLLQTRPPLVALESNPVNIQICTLYAQKRARLFRHYRSLIDLTDMGDRRIVKQLAGWLYKSAKTEGADFVAVWCDDVLSEHENEALAKTIVIKALVVVVDMLGDDDYDPTLTGELQEFLRHI